MSNIIDAKERNERFNEKTEIREVLFSVMRKKDSHEWNTHVITGQEGQPIMYVRCNFGKIDGYDFNVHGDILLNDNLQINFFTSQLAETKFFAIKTLVKTFTEVWTDKQGERIESPRLQVYFDHVETAEDFRQVKTNDPELKKIGLVLTPANDWIDSKFNKPVVNTPIFTHHAPKNEDALF